MCTSFLDIIRCTDMSELQKLCKSTTITMAEFVDFIVACKAGFTHLNHTMHYADFVPAELEEKSDDWKILNADAATQATKQGQKALRRLFKAHGKGQYRVGHMFFSKEFVHPIGEWHFVFFEVNELRVRDNHWEMGPHVHITNYLWPNLYCQPIWEQFVLNREFPQAKLHLSCTDERRKDA
jgi:hypothetical protein